MLFPGLIYVKLWWVTCKDCITSVWGRVQPVSIETILTSPRPHPTCLDILPLGTDRPPKTMGNYQRETPTWITAFGSLQRCTKRCLEDRCRQIFPLLFGLLPFKHRHIPCYCTRYDTVSSVSCGHCHCTHRNCMEYVQNRITLNTVMERVTNLCVKPSTSV